MGALLDKDSKEDKKQGAATRHEDRSNHGSSTDGRRSGFFSRAGSSRFSRRRSRTQSANQGQNDDEINQAEQRMRNNSLREGRPSTGSSVQMSEGDRHDAYLRQQIDDHGSPRKFRPPSTNTSDTNQRYGVHDHTALKPHDQENRTNLSQADFKKVRRHSSRKRVGISDIFVERREPRGIRNFGNTCYLNAVLQNICQTFLLEDLLMNNSPSDNSKLLTNSLIALYTAMPSAKSPNNIFCKVAMNEAVYCLLRSLSDKSERFSARSQQDSHEVLRHLMEGIKQEQIAMPNKSAGLCQGLTVVDQVFGGHYLTIFDCFACHKPYHIFEPFLDISLQILPTYEPIKRRRSYRSKNDELDYYLDAIRQATEILDWSEIPSKSDLLLYSLEYLTRVEELNEYMCLNCNQHSHDTQEFRLTKGSKQTLIYNPPAILTIHLKRFKSTSHGYVKENKHIAFTEELNLAPFCMQYSRGQRKQKPSFIYSLYGLVVHHGSLQEGHYTACVRMRTVSVQRAKAFIQKKFFNREHVTGMTDFSNFISSIRQNPEFIDDVPPHTSTVDDQWFHISDSTVDKVSKEDVLKQKAYLLFYERVS